MPVHQQDCFLQSTATLEELQLESAAVQNSAQANPGTAQQRAPAAGADDGGVSWAAWRADQRGEVRPCLPLHHHTVLAHPRHEGAWLAPYDKGRQLLLVALP